MPTTKRQFQIDVDDMPTHWYNILADLPEPLPPPKDPEDGPSRLQQLPNLLIGECLRQEMSNERWIEIPEALNARATYSIGALSERGRGWVELVRSEAGQTILRRHGFAP